MLMNITKKLRRLLCALLFFTVFPGGAVPVFAEGEGVTEYFRQDFSGCAEEADFTAEHKDFGISYVTGRMQVKDKAVRINTCDMRWWSMNYIDAEVHFSFTVSADERYTDTLLYFSVQNHTASTTTESPDGGLTTALVPKDGRLVLTDRSGRELAEIPKDGSRHTVLVTMRQGSDVYSISLDSKVLADDCKFVSPMYGVFGMRFHGDSSTEGSYLTLDDILFTAKGRSYPQKFSYQEPGELPSISLPPAVEEENITFWHNGVRADCPVELVYENGDIALPAGWVISVLGEPVSPVADDIVMASELPALYRAKLWLDEYNKMLIVTTGEQKNDGILRKYGSLLVMNGQPYYEISFNKFDLNRQIAADPRFNDGTFPNGEFPEASACLPGAEEALRQLSENGFRTIRVFCNNINMDRSEEEREKFFAAADAMYDLCDKYNIRVVACLGLLSTEFLEGSYAEGAGWVTGGESAFDLYTNPDSASRQNVYEFLDAYIPRYKDRDTILMWEIQNEGNLDADVGTQVRKIGYSLAQLAAYYGDMADRIRQNDPERLITGGDSILRSAQWHLFAGTMRGSQTPDWTTDSREERLKCLVMLHEKLDVISVHGYGTGYTESYITEDGKTAYTDWELFLSEAKRLGRGLYNGETGGMLQANGKPAQNLPNTGKEAAEARRLYLDGLIESGVQLTHWWAFHSDRRTFGNDVDTWSVRTDDETAATFEVIREANKALQARYGVNLLPYCEPENSEADADSTAAVTESAAEPAAERDNTKSGGFTAIPVLAGVGVGAILAGAAAVLYAALRKRRNNRKK